MKQTSEGVYVIYDRWSDIAWLRSVLHAARLPEVAASGGGEIGIDVETKTDRKNAKAPDARRDTLVGVGIGVTLSSEATLPVYGLATDEYIALLAEELPSFGWYAHNAMFDATVLRRYGVSLGEHRGDARIIAYLLGEAEAGLKPLLQRWLQYPTMEYEEILEAWGAADISEVPVEVQADYCALQDASQCVRLEHVMRRELPERSLQVYTGIELPMVNILVEMSQRGIRFDREAAQPMWEQESAGVAGLDAIIQQLVDASGFKQWEMRNDKVWNPTCKACRNGKNKRLSCESCQGSGKLDPVRRPFNPGSSDQLREWLYGHLHAPVRRYAGGIKDWQARRAGAGGEEVEGSTDGLALLQLKGFHEAMPLIISRRKLNKRVGFLASWLEKSVSDGRLHTQFTNTKVVSGRLSSREPNLTQVEQSLRTLFTADI